MIYLGEGSLAERRIERLKAGHEALQGISPSKKMAGRLRKLALWMDKVQSGELDANSLFKDTTSNEIQEDLRELATAADKKAEETKRAIEAIKGAAKLGRIEFSPRAADAISRMRLGDPDYTIRSISITFWGPWKRNSGGMGECRLWQSRLFNSRWQAALYE